MTDLDLAALRALAEAATPGEWAMFNGTDIFPNDDFEGDRQIADCCVSACMLAAEQSANAAYIAAASPAVVLALIERVERAEKALAEWREEPPGGISKGGVLYLSPERVAARERAARVAALEEAANAVLESTRAPGQRNIKDQWREDIGIECAATIRALAQEVGE